MKRQIGMTTLDGLVKSGFSEEVELNRRSRGTRALVRGASMCKGPETEKGLLCAHGQITIPLREGTASPVK